MDTYVASTGSIALAASTDQTLLQIASPSDLRGRLLGFSVSFDGVDPSELPILVTLVRQTSAGTGDPITPAPIDVDAPAAQFTAEKAHTSEPSTSVILGSWFVTPVGGLVMMTYALDEAPIIDVSSRLALKAEPGNTVNAAATLTFVQ